MSLPSEHLSPQVMRCSTAAAFSAAAPRPSAPSH